MRIAIPIWDNKVSPVMDTASRLLIIETDGEIVGSVLGGFDGRRGYIYHLAVVEKMKGRGVGKMLMDELVYS